MTRSNGCPVVHFEIGCKDLEGTTAFYSGLFGWAPTATPYASLLEMNSKAGIGGHITALGHEPQQYVTFYIEVKDIDEMLKRIEAAGGKKLIAPVPLPDGRKFAWFTDPGGNMVGLITKG